MRKEKFLTVYAVFDEDTQVKLNVWQQAILQNNLCGRQSIDIPFHISLGRFKTDLADKLIERIYSA